MKILAVDDIEQNRHFLKKLIMRHGYAVETASNGAEALEKVRESPPDMIITDTLMPKMDGFQLCRMLKRDEKLKNIPVLFYSATYTDKKSRELALKIGAEEYITKPIEPEKFIEIIEETFEKQERDELKQDGKPLEEPVYMELYNERLIQKLEEKMLDLARSETKYRSVVESVDDLICLIDCENRFLSCNRKSLERFGLMSEDIAGRKISEIASNPADAKLTMQMVRKVFETGKPVSCERELDFRGERRWYSSKMAPIFDGDGSVTAAVCVGRDITECKAAEEALRRAEQEKAAILNSLSEHVLYQDTEMRILWANRVAGESVGLTPDELVGSHCYEIWHQRSEPCVGCPVIKARETGQPQEGEITTPDGRVWFIRGDPVRDADGSIVGAVEITLEITERKLAEQELAGYREHLEELVNEKTSQLEENTRELEQANIRLQELDRLKSMFIASMSHELRTPLNSIIGFTGMMLQGLSGDVSKEMSEELGIVYDSAKHLLSLINDVIDISKIEADQLEAYFGEVNLDEVLREAITAVSREAEAKKLEIKTDFPEGISIISDRKRLFQCVLNLLNNAVKFTEDGTIELRASKEAKILKISVSDTGIGIREEDVPEIFVPFTRLDSPLKEKTMGTGLGLYLTKKIMTSVFNGDIMVESQYRRGSTFTLIIPLQPVVR